MFILLSQSRQKKVLFRVSASSFKSTVKVLRGSRVTSCVTCVITTNAPFVSNHDVVTMANADALLSHILSQTKANIDFLISQKQISQADGRDILAKLPIADDNAIIALSQQTQNLAFAQSEPIPSPNNSVILSRRGVPPPPKRATHVRALWNWNDNGEVCS